MVKPGPSSSTTEQANDCSKYRGVRKRKWGKWVSEIRLPNSRERIWLGSYDSPEKAARAFDAALFCLRGPDAKFNFPNTKLDIRQGELLSHQEIQELAAKFANEQEEEENNNNNRHEQCYPESSSPLSDGVAAGAPVEEGGNAEMAAVDWSFLKWLDYSNDSAYDYNYFPRIDDDNSGVFFPPPATTGPDDNYITDNDNNGDENGDNQSFSQLWNF
ncbi:hypothetical protein UlMin_035794 [Ulmus minor]